MVTRGWRIRGPKTASCIGPPWSYKRPWEWDTGSETCRSFLWIFVVQFVQFFAALVCTLRTVCEFPALTSAVGSDWSARAAGVSWLSGEVQRSPGVRRRRPRSCRLISNWSECRTTGRSKVCSDKSCLHAEAGLWPAQVSVCVSALWALI